MNDQTMMNYLAEIEEYMFYKKEHFTDDLGMYPQIFGQLRGDIADAMRVLRNYGVKGEKA